MKFRRANWLTLLAIVGVIAYAIIALMNMRTKVEEANQTEAELRQQVEQLQEGNAALQYAIDNQYDDEIIEDIARNKLGLVAAEEKIFYDSGQ